MYLRLLLAEQGIDEVSWYDMPSLKRRAAGIQQLLLAQWRRATMVQPVVAGVALFILAVLLAGRVAQVVNL